MVTSSEKPLIIFTLIDALGWAYVKDKKFMDNVLPYRTKLSTILGFSCACIPSILSGKYPNEHYQWNLFYYSPKTSPFRWTKYIPYFGRGYIERVSRKIIEEVSKKMSRGDGYFETYIMPLKLLHLFDISERKNIYQPNGLNRVSSVFDWMVERKINYKAYNYRQGTDSDLINQAVLDLRKNDKDVLFIYLSQLDSYLHSNCKDKKFVDEKLHVYENYLMKLYETGKNQGRDVKMYLFSDHGMVPTEKTVDLMAVINKTGLKQPKDYVGVFDSTMGRFWCFSQKAKTMIIQALKQQKEGKILDDDDRERYNIDIGNNLYGEIIYLLPPGVLIEPGTMGVEAPAGMHGCDPNHPYSDGLLMSNQDFNLKRRDITALYYMMVDEMKKHILHP